MHERMTRLFDAPYAIMPHVPMQWLLVGTVVLFVAFVVLVLWPHLAKLQADAARQVRVVRRGVVRRSLAWHGGWVNGYACAHGCMRVRGWVGLHVA